MPPDSTETLKKRVVSAAEAALADHQYVSAMETFREWAEARGLRPTEIPYVRSTRTGPQDLQFSRSGEPSIEKAWRTHFISPELPAPRREKLQQRLAKPPQPVVFEILRDSQRSEWGAELPRGSFLTMEGEQALCLSCARMGDLEFLPAGDTALTRRATKYSGRTGVVVRFSRSRGRYERQGILVEEPALEKADWSARKTPRNGRAREHGTLSFVGSRMTSWLRG